MINILIIFNRTGPYIYWQNNKNGAYHRLDGPAIVYSSGTKVWRKDGKLHRGDDKPAVIHPDGTKEWWKEGKLIKRETK